MKNIKGLFFKKKNQLKKNIKDKTYVSDNVKNINVPQNVKDKFGIDPDSNKKPWLLIIGGIAVLVLIVNLALGGPFKEIKKFQQAQQQDSAKETVVKDTLPQNDSQTIITEQEAVVDVEHPDVEFRFLNTDGYCTLVQSKLDNILINTGASDDGSTILKALSDHEIDQVDIVMTEWNDNTSGCLLQLLQADMVKKIYMASDIGNNDYGKRCFSIISSKEIELIKVEDVMNLTFAGVDVMLVPITNSYPSRLTMRVADGKFSATIAIGCTVEDLKSVVSKFLLNDISTPADICYISTELQDTDESIALIKSLSKDTFIVQPENGNITTMEGCFRKSGLKMLNLTQEQYIYVKSDKENFVID